jgi:hypothetical protein
LKKPNRKKKLIKILKKPAGSVWFRFYKQKTEKTETGKKTQAKPKKSSQNRKNRAKPVFALKTEPNRNRSV